jgi:5-methylcytosine-specific restriction endonuclease McrA
MTNINIETRTGTCSIDGEVEILRRWINGGIQWRCAVKRRSERRAEQRSQKPRTPESMAKPHRRVMRDRIAAGLCERCGFQAAHRGQLDVDHIMRRIDGGTHDPDNLWVLCANCHRLKSIYEKLGTFDLETFKRAGTTAIVR